MVIMNHPPPPHTHPNPPHQPCIVVSTDRPAVGGSSVADHNENAYSNILKILQPKMENFQIKKSYIFHISAQNIDCGYSLEPPR